MSLNNSDAPDSDVSLLSTANNDDLFPMSTSSSQPMRKRGRNEILHETLTENVDSNIVYNSNSNPTQESMHDSCVNSQFSFSQDMNDRFVRLSFPGCSQGDDSNSYQKQPDDDTSQQSNTSHFVPFHQHILKNQGIKAESERKQVMIAPAIINPFLQEKVPVIPVSKGKQLYRSLSDERNDRGPVRKPYPMWIEAYEERPYFLCHFQDEGQIGKGVGGKVYKARGRLDGCLYAVKELSTPITTENAKTLALKEAFALAALQGCPNLIRYHNSWFQDEHLWIQTELCLDSNLGVFINGIASDHRLTTGVPCSQDDPYYSQSDLITPRFAVNPIMFPDDTTCEGIININDTTLTSDGIPERLAWLVLISISEALQYMHHRGLAHLDIRPMNIFISPKFIREDENYLYGTLQNISDGLLDGSLSLKLGDLGNCLSLSSDPSKYEEGEERYLPLEMLTGSSPGPSISYASVFGLKAADTAQISRNESVVQPRGQLDLTKCDIFSLGATVYELCKGTPLPLSSDRNDDDISEWQELRDGLLHSAVTKKYSVELIALLRDMMQSDPRMRPTAAVVVDVARKVETARLKLLTGNCSVETTEKNLEQLKSLLSKLNIPYEEDLIQLVTRVLQNCTGEQ